MYFSEHDLYPVPEGAVDDGGMMVRYVKFFCLSGIFDAFVSEKVFRHVFLHLAVPNVFFIS